MEYKGGYYTSSYFIRVGLFPMCSPSSSPSHFLSLNTSLKSKKSRWFRRINFKTILDLSISNHDIVFFFFFPYLRPFKIRFHFMIINELFFVLNQRNIYSKIFEKLMLQIKIVNNDKKNTINHTEIFIYFNI